MTERQNSVTCKYPTLTCLKIKVGAGRWKMSKRLRQVANLLVCGGKKEETSKSGCLYLSTER